MPEHFRSYSRVAPAGYKLKPAFLDHLLMSSHEWNTVNTRNIFLQNKAIHLASHNCILISELFVIGICITLTATDCYVGDSGLVGTEASCNKCKFSHKDQVAQHHIFRLPSYISSTAFS